MDFFASQELARKNTRKLVILLIITMVCLVGSIYCLVMVAGNMASEGHENPLFHGGLLNLPVLGIVALVVSSIVSGGSLLKISELRAGGTKVASMLGGRRLLPGSVDPAERRVLNVVEEMALASGIPVPPVYILDGEDGINAFAAGHTIDDAVIGMNRGTIDLLSRDELQGVIAHEYSHILNGDMRMSLRLIGILHGVQAIALIGWLILRTVGSGSHRRSSNSKDGGGAMVILAIGVGLLVLGSLGLFFARLIKASISRQREFLADASSVQFTRNPEAISGALKMIGVASDHSQVRAAQAEMISHMFFANMSGSLMAGLLSTHPPLVARIQRVEPRFDGNFQEWYKTRPNRSRQEQEPEKKKEVRPGFRKPGFGIMGSAAGGNPVLDRFPIDPALMIAAIGSPTEDDFIFSRMLVGKIPERLLAAIRDTYLARCVVFAFLLDQGETFRDKQCEYIAANHGQATLDDTLAIEPLIRSADLRWRLPMFEIVQGALSGLSPQQYTSFRAGVNWMVESDGRISLFEFFLQHHLVTHLDRHFGRKTADKIRYEKINPVLPEVSVLLNMLVKHGQEEPARRQATLQAACAELPESVRPSIRLSNTAPNVSELNEAVNKLSQSSPAVRKQFLSAAATAIAHDRQVSVTEAELFRALAESLDCPVPPVIANNSITDETV